MFSVEVIRGFATVSVLIPGAPALTSVVIEEGHSHTISVSRKDALEGWPSEVNGERTYTPGAYIDLFVITDTVHPDDESARIGPYHTRVTFPASFSWSPTLGWQ